MKKVSKLIFAVPIMFSHMLSKVTLIASVLAFNPDKMKVWIKI